MIQQYLDWSHRGRFMNGTTLFKPELGFEIRQRILKRAFPVGPRYIEGASDARSVTALDGSRDVQEEGIVQVRVFIDISVLSK